MTDTMVYRIELMHAAVLGIADLTAPGRQWALCVDGRLASHSDVP